MTSLYVWVVCGGPSSEAEVSRTSARAVLSALEGAGHRVRLVEFEPEMTLALLKDRPDVVFPLTHGTLGEDGCLQGLLEVFDVPYVGCGVLASAIGANKPMAKAIWRAQGLPVASEFVVRKDEPLSERAARIRAEIPGALAVKPASGGSAIGIQRVGENEGAGELVSSLNAVFAMDTEALVEPWIAGKEVTCGVIEDADGLRALPPTLIMPARADFYDFASKYAPGGSKHLCPAPLPEAYVARIKQLAVLAHQAIGARDMSRTDFIVDESKGADRGLTILEINTLPGMTATSLFPEAAGISGIPFKVMVDSMVRRAFARPRRLVPEALAMPA